MKPSIIIYKEGLCEGCEYAEIEIQNLYSLEKTYIQYARCIHELVCSRAYDHGLHDGLKGKQRHVDEVTEQ